MCEFMQVCVDTCTSSQGGHSCVYGYYENLICSQTIALWVHTQYKHMVMMWDGFLHAVSERKFKQKLSLFELKNAIISYLSFSWHYCSLLYVYYYDIHTVYCDCDTQRRHNLVYVCVSATYIPVTVS